MEEGRTRSSIKIEGHKHMIVQGREQEGQKGSKREGTEDEVTRGA